MKNTRPIVTSEIRTCIDNTDAVTSMHTYHTRHITLSVKGL